MRINQYLKYGSIFDVKYKDPIYTQVSLNDALRVYFKKLELPDGYHLASSGGIDSSIIWCLKKYPAFCVSSTGNKDIHYAKILNPDIREIRFDVDLEHELILTARLWDLPHCGKTDPYDHFVYRNYNKVITGEELYHLDTFKILRLKGDYIDRFTETVEIFTDKEIRELGHEPYRVKLRQNNIYHLESFLYDCWTKVSRKIFYRFEHVFSPFLTKKFIGFYRILPISLKTHKNLQNVVAGMYLPDEILDRKKNYHTNGPNKEFIMEYRRQYTGLIEKYLTDKSMKIFDDLDYKAVQKSLNNYRKMWCLLNYSIWKETKNGYVK